MEITKRSSSKVSDIEDRNRMDCLPEEVAVEILSRLPITSLMQFKAVSHTCHDLSAHPRLPPMFFKQVTSLTSSNPSLILHCTSDLPNEVYILDTEHQPLSARKIRINPRSQSEVSKFELVGSCNGLLCLRLHNNPRCFGKLETDILLQVYNPFAGDVVEVPRATRYMNQEEVFGFGFHPRTGEYKVMRIVCYTQLMTPALGGLHDGFIEVKKSAVEVLSLKTNCWRSKGGSPKELLDLKAPPHALVQGSLHWLCSSNSIISFDLGDEVFRKVPCPESMAGMANNLVTLGGCLSLSAVSLAENVRIDVWRMKQYNVKESWVKEVSFSPGVPPGRCGLDWSYGAIARHYKIICVMKNGEFVMQCGGSCFVSYDPVRKKFKSLHIKGLPHKFQPFPFVPSLFSAKTAIQMSC